MCLVRLSKILAQRGLCSRREADQWIREGRVRVKGQPVALEASLFPPDVEVEIDQAAQVAQAALITVALNKPVGWVSAQPEHENQPAIQLLQTENYWRFPQERPPVVPRRLGKFAVVGRLDKDSRGLLLFTQDGRLAKQVIGQESLIEKEYVVQVRGVLSPMVLDRLRHGLALDGRELRPAQVELEDKQTLRVILEEGRYRQIRRMCKMVGLRVVDLWRVRIGQLHLDSSLREGEWRLVEPHEIVGSNPFPTHHGQGKE